MTASRLTGTRLIDIRENVSWSFDSSFVVIENKGQPIPIDVVDAVLAREVTCDRIKAAWQLDETAGLLILSSISADGEVLQQKATIPIKPAGHIRVNLGTRQYNMFREKSKQP